MAGNHYKMKHFNKKNLKAKVTNDTSVDIPTLSFKKDFASAANDIKNYRTKIKKQLNIVIDQVDAIRKDDKTGKLIKDALVNHEKALKKAKKTFLDATKALYDSAIDEYNTVLQKAYASINQANTTKVSTETAVTKENLTDN